MKCVFKKISETKSVTRLHCDVERTGNIKTENLEEKKHNVSWSKHSRKVGEKGFGCFAKIF